MVLQMMAVFNLPLDTQRTFIIIGESYLQLSIFE
jgi:hypothetical protein